jgi:hypothetical protein
MNPLPTMLPATGANPVAVLSDLGYLPHPWQHRLPALINVIVQHTEVGRYALIATSLWHDMIELLLDDDLPTPQSLRRHAEARRRDATTLAGDTPPSHFLAALIDDAADCYERGTG